MHKVGSKLKALHNKIADKGGNFIARRVMLKPSIDHDKGVKAEKARETLLRRREYIKNQKQMGY